MKLAKALSGILLFALLTGASADTKCHAEWYDSDRSCLERARTLFGTGQFDEAQKALDKGVALNPRNAELFYMRGVLYSTMKRFDLALADMDQAIALNPNSAFYYVARGTLYSNQNKYDLAIKDYDQALRYEPRNDSARVNKEYCQTELQKIADAAAGKTQVTSSLNLGVAVSTAVPIPVPKAPKEKHTKKGGADVGAVSNESANLARLTKELEEKQKLKEQEQALSAKLDAERKEKEELLKKLAEIKVASRTADKKATEEAKPEDKPVKDKWALIIGISKFKNETLNLRYPSKDAKDFYDYLITDGKFQKDHVKLLLDDQATRGNILSELGDRWLPRMAAPDDLVLIYFSSHGSSSDLDVGGVNYLLAHDSEPDQLFASGLAMQDLTRVIKGRVHSDRVVLILDACHSGAAEPESKGLTRVKNVDAEAIAQGTGQLVISSSLPSQVSWESKEVANSVFTRYLIDGLKSKGDKTTLNEAFNFMKDKVQGEVLRARGVLQTPVLKSKWQGHDIVISAPPIEPRIGL
ncbi:MAG: hypothetical protein C0507_10710 [Cyanobacteria bacterium PR.3.49]|nr:hypothetical protein [Cyanobacteria bacterium PR.3.49]